MADCPSPGVPGPRRDAPLVGPPRRHGGRSCNGPREQVHPQVRDSRRPGRGRLGRARRVDWDGRPRRPLPLAWPGSEWDLGGVAGRSPPAPRNQLRAKPPAACGGCIAVPGARDPVPPPPSDALPSKKGAGSGAPVGGRPAEARPAKGRPDGLLVARIALILQGMRPGPRQVACGLAAAPKPGRSVGFGCCRSLDSGRYAWKLWPWNRP